MRRALAAAVLAVVLAAPGCVPTYRAEYIDGSDLQSRYPDALDEARRGWAITTAMALGLFTLWMAADLALRVPIGATREERSSLRPPLSAPWWSHGW